MRRQRDGERLRNLDGVELGEDSAWTARRMARLLVEVLEERDEDDEGEEQFSLEVVGVEEEHEAIATTQEHKGYAKVEGTIDSGSCVSMMPKREVRQEVDLPEVFAQHRPTQTKANMTMTI